MGKSIFSRAGLITAEDKKDLEKRLEELEQATTCTTRAANKIATRSGASA